jgi:outer membrane protein assembly factor BamB
VNTIDAARSRWRIVPGVMATVLGVVMCGVLADHFVLQAEWWQVDRTVTHAPPPPLAGFGPPPGPVTTSWQLSTRVDRTDLPEFDRVAYSLVDGELVIVSGRGLDVRDARTGQERWHYRRDHWTLLGWARTGQSLIAYFERTGHRDNRLMVGLDAVSGTLLWRQRDEVPAATDRTTLRWPADGGVVMVTDEDRHALYGLSTATGGRLWTRHLSHGCLVPDAMPYASAADGGVAAFSLDCGTQDRILVIDSHTGHALFTVPSGGRTADAAVTVDAGVTAVFDGRGLSAYDRRGRRFFVRGGADVCRVMCPMAVDDGHLLVAYGAASWPVEDASAMQRLESVDIAHGTSGWHRDLAGYTALTVAGGLVYGLRSHLVDPLLPAAIDVIDPSTGRGTSVPAPMVVRPGLGGVRPWLGSGGGLLYVALPAARPRPFGTARLLALRGRSRGLGPSALAGVRAVDWPDACTLLTSHDLPAGYSADPADTRVEGLRLQAGCTYRPRRHGRVPDGPRAGVMSVTVQWVAADPGSASVLFAAARDTQGGASDPVKVGDAAYSMGVPSGGVMMRVGRTIVTVTAGIPGAATRLAAAVAARLRAGS